MMCGSVCALCGRLWFERVQTGVVEERRKGGPCMRGNSWSLSFHLLNIIYLILVRPHLARLPGTTLTHSRADTRCAYRLVHSNPAQTSKILSTLSTVALVGRGVARTPARTLLLHTVRRPPTTLQPLPPRRASLHTTPVRPGIFERLWSIVSPTKSPSVPKANGKRELEMSNAGQGEALSPIPPLPAPFKLDASKGPLVWIDCE